MAVPLWDFPELLQAFKAFSSGSPCTHHFSKIYPTLCWSLGSNGHYEIVDFFLCQFDRRFGLHRFKLHLKTLEVSCHGLTWLGGVFAALYFAPSGMHLWMNLLAFLLLDIAVVATIKVQSRQVSQF